jgi:hypothetical protein
MYILLFHAYFPSLYVHIGHRSPSSFFHININEKSTEKNKSKLTIMRKEKSLSQPMTLRYFEEYIGFFSVFLRLLGFFFLSTNFSSLLIFFPMVISSLQLPTNDQVNTELVCLSVFQLTFIVLVDNRQRFLFSLSCLLLCSIFIIIIILSYFVSWYFYFIIRSGVSFVCY